MELSGLNQEQHQKLHFQPQRNGQAKVGMTMHGLHPSLQQQHQTSPQVYPVAAQTRATVYSEMASAFMPGLGGMATSAAAGQSFAPFASGPISATFGMFGPQAIPAPLFTLEEQENEDDENEEITDMEKLRYKYEYEIKSAIDSTSALADVNKVMTTPYSTGAFSYGIGNAVGGDYASAYGAYPMAAPVALGRYHYDGSATAGPLNLFTAAAAAAMVPSSSTTSTLSTSSTMAAVPSNYPIVHTSALPPSHHHQEYLEYTLGNMLTNMPV
ncbi:hypothetical protein BG004_001427 [Podila humilis]|nr:hypothetical protein BG004_001427 [Podila humilis]